LPFDQVLRKYFVSGNWTIAEGQSGWNNTTRFVEADGKKWVLRIYETHKDASKIRYEHEILLALNERKLDFRVPKPVQSDDGSTIVKLEDGTDRLACVFTYIDGHRPEGGNGEIAYAFGQVTGKLSKALADLKVISSPVYRPYYEMSSSYPHCDSDQVAAFCYTPTTQFKKFANELKVIGDSLQHFRTLLPQFQALPHQLIHGDINHSNSLVADYGSKSISAILDFEFCTWDLRVMEIAVILSGLLSGEDAIDHIDCYLAGVGQQLHLERSEIEAIPLLVQLRILDVFLHFLNRFLEGVDGEDVLDQQLVSTYEGILKLENVRAELFNLCIRHLTA